MPGAFAEAFPAGAGAGAGEAGGVQPSPAPDCCGSSPSILPFGDLWPVQPPGSTAARLRKQPGGEREGVGGWEADLFSWSWPVNGQFHGWGKAGREGGRERARSHLLAGRQGLEAACARAAELQLR